VPFVTPRDSNGSFLTVWAADLRLLSNSLIGTLPSIIGLLTNLREFVDALTTYVRSAHV
jgi:hypothetical protein